jgi:hypothetical protein
MFAAGPGCRVGTMAPRFAPYRKGGKNDNNGARAIY